MKVDVHEGKLADLVAALRAGEEVVIEDGGEVVARLVAPDAPLDLLSDTPRRFRFGSLSHLAGTVPDFPPIPDEDLDRWEREKEERIAAGLAKPAG